MTFPPGAQSSTASSRPKPQRGRRHVVVPAEVIWSGAPTDPLEGGWPPGWTKTLVRRQSGATRGDTDQYWYPPPSSSSTTQRQQKQRRLRSMVEVKRFLQAMRQCQGNVDQAWIVFRQNVGTANRRGAQKKGTNQKGTNQGKNKNKSRSRGNDSTRSSFSNATNAASITAAARNHHAKETRILWNLRHALHVLPLHEVQRQLRALKQTYSYSKPCIRALINRPIPLLTADGSHVIATTTLVQTLVQNRYNHNHHVFGVVRQQHANHHGGHQASPLLQHPPPPHVMEDPDDARGCVRELLDVGADFSARIGPTTTTTHAAATATTPLHVAMACGRHHLVRAILEEVVDDDLFEKQQQQQQFMLWAWDGCGDTPLHAAVCRGQWRCAGALVDALLSSSSSFSSVKEEEFTKLLFQLVDRQGDNVLSCLCRHSDVKYGCASNTTTTATATTTPEHRSSSSSQSLVLLKRLLQVLVGKRWAWPLLHTNRQGENCLHIAATCGHLEEVKLLSEIQLETGRSVANVMTKKRDDAAAAASSGKTPLELAMETLSTVQSSNSSDDAAVDHRLGARGILIAGRWYTIDRGLREQWMANGIRPTIALLQSLQLPKIVTLEDDVLASRPNGSDIVTGQVLSEDAQTLKEEVIMRPTNNEMSESNTGRFHIRCEVPGWTDNKFETLRPAILQMLETGGGTTIPLMVSPVLLRDPKHPCLRVSNMMDCWHTKHYGLCATARIPENTVICEYAGEVCLDKSTDAFPPSDCATARHSAYGMKLAKCDEYVLERDGPQALAFVLDARRKFNEASLINDCRVNILDDNQKRRQQQQQQQQQRDDRQEEANVKFLEVLVNEWPHIFVVSTKKIEKDKELLLDYGQEYWDKIVNRMLTQRVDDLERKKGHLERDNADLRVGQANEPNRTNALLKHRVAYLERQVHHLEDENLNLLAAIPGNATWQPGRNIGVS